MSKSSDDNATKTRKTKNTTDSRSETVCKAVSRTEGCSTEQSQITGIQGHISDDKGASVWGSGYKSSESGVTDPGKILEAVKLIEEKHISYVKAHQQRLISRLDESKESESDFKKAIQELEAQIYQLISDKKLKEPE